MSILKTIFHQLTNIQGMSDAQALTYARSLELKRPKDAPGTPMFRAWRKLIAGVAAAIEADGIPTAAQFKVCAQAVADANFIAMTGYLPTHNDILDGMRLQWAESAERVAELSEESNINKSLEEMKLQMMGLSDSQLSQFKRDFMAIPITDPYFEMVQDILAVCESVQSARMSEPVDPG